MFQMQNFINTLNDICEFTFLDGPKNVTREAPLQYFVDKGITPPYKRWMMVAREPYRTLPDGSVIATFTKSNVNFMDAIEACYYITEFINKQEEAFDGICGFSQGGY